MIAASIEPLRALARGLYVASELSMAEVACALPPLTARRLNRWSQRDGGWLAQRIRYQRHTRPVTANVGRVARRAVATLERRGLTHGEAARSLFAHVAALVLEAERTEEETT